MLFSIHHRYRNLRRHLHFFCLLRTDPEAKRKPLSLLRARDSRTLLTSKSKESLLPSRVAKPSSRFRELLYSRDASAHLLYLYESPNNLVDDAQPPYESRFPGSGHMELISSAPVTSAIAQASSHSRQLTRTTYAYTAILAGTATPSDGSTSSLASICRLGLAAASLILTSKTIPRGWPGWRLSDELCTTRLMEFRHSLASDMRHVVPGYRSRISTLLLLSPQSLRRSSVQSQSSSSSYSSA